MNTASFTPSSTLRVRLESIGVGFTLSPKLPSEVRHLKMKDLSTLPQIIQGLVLGNLWEAEPNHPVPQTCKTFCGLWRQYGAAKALFTSDSRTT